MPVNRGFSLIELLVVMLILSISVTFGVLAFGDFGQARKVKVTTEHFVYFLKLLQQQAILTGKTYAVIVNKNGYQAQVFENNHWQSINNKSFKPQKLAKNIYLFVKQASKNPYLTVDSTGRISNANLDFLNGKQAIYRLNIYNNTVKIENLTND